MIIIGYQGIGKSTLARTRSLYIDLESSSFWHDGKRPEDWYIYYCNIAEHLSDQGYVVLLSSHEVVRNELIERRNKNVVCIYPVEELRDEWCDRLKSRYENSPTDKNYKAWKNAEDRYLENIKELRHCGIPFVEITDMNYNLDTIIRKKAWPLLCKYAGGIENV